MFCWQCNDPATLQGRFSLDLNVILWFSKCANYFCVSATLYCDLFHSRALHVLNSFEKKKKKGQNISLSVSTAEIK